MNHPFALVTRANKFVLGYATGTGSVFIGIVLRSSGPWMDDPVTLGLFLLAHGKAVNLRHSEIFEVTAL